MQDTDFAYYERRAEQELALAQQYSDKRVVAAHFELACRYLDLVHAEAPQFYAGESSSTGTGDAATAAS